MSEPIASPERKRLDLRRLESVFEGPLGVRSLALTGLFLLACFYTLYFARDFFLPVVFALVLNFLLAPVVRFLERWKIPTALGAALVLVVAVVLTATLLFQLASPFASWLERLPEIGTKLQAKSAPVRAVLGRASVVSDQVDKQLQTRTRNRSTPQTVLLKGPSLLDTLFNGTSKLFLTLIVIVVLLYFLLASGDLFLSKLVHVLPKLSDKKKAVRIAGEIEHNISRYLFTITFINVGVGVGGGLLFWGLGLPNPALWGVFAALLNFVPTVGALSIAALVAIVAFATFDSVGHALLVPASFLAMTSLVGTFLSPILMSKRLTLNSVVIFLSLSFWGWLWGVPGALLAVPMLAMFKIFCDHIEPLAPIGEFLGR